jgi:hypothetical protein
MQLYASLISILNYSELLYAAAVCTSREATPLLGDRVLAQAGNRASSIQFAGRQFTDSRDV